MLTAGILICFLWQVFESVLPHSEFLAMGLLLGWFGTKHRIRLPGIQPLFLYIFFQAGICLLLGTLDIGGFAVQMGSVLFSVLFFYNIVFYYPVQEIMRTYCRVAFWFSVFALIQSGLATCGYPIFYRLHFLLKSMKEVSYGSYLYRVEGLCSEPMLFATLLVPAMYVSLRTLLYKNKTTCSYSQAVIILIAYCWTISAVAFVILGISMAFLLLEPNDPTQQYRDKGQNLKKLIWAVVSMIAFLSLYRYSDEIGRRISETMQAFLLKMRPEKLNLSTYAIVSNLIVVKNMLVDTWGTGVGFGSYSRNFDVYSTGLVRIKEYGINRLDASTMINRLLGEIGIWGFLLAMITLFYYRRNTAPQNLWISNAMLMAIITRMVRLGNYTFGGFALCLCLYVWIGQNDHIRSYGFPQCGSDDRTDPLQRAGSKG